MIKIETNRNFSEWLNISLFGRVIDNAKSRANALRIAHKIQDDQLKVGIKMSIVNRK